RRLVLVDHALADGLVQLACRGALENDGLFDVPGLGSFTELADSGLQRRLDRLVAQTSLLVLPDALLLRLDVRHAKPCSSYVRMCVVTTRTAPVGSRATRRSAEIDARIETKGSKVNVERLRHGLPLCPGKGNARTAAPLYRWMCSQSSSSSVHASSASSSGAWTAIPKLSRWPCAVNAIRTASTAVAAAAGSSAAGGTPIRSPIVSGTVRSASVVCRAMKPPYREPLGIPVPLPDTTTTSDSSATRRRKLVDQ